MTPCGPVIDAGAADRAREVLSEAADASGWRDLLEQAWPALAPVFGASPYLAGLARGMPDRLRRALEADPQAATAAILDDVRTLEAEPDIETVRRRLRQRKGDAHLLTALADLGGVWDLAAVTSALTELADASVRAALAAAVRQEVERGRLHAATDDRGPVPGFFCIAMGKHGAFELNYSSDIDVSLFYEPDRMPLAEGAEHQDVAARLARSLSQLLQERTADGYVFRVDLRLRPDPSATPAAVPVPAALEYYETVGQNWERAAFIKARAVAGDALSAADFLQELQPFVWRRNLDFASIEDIHSIKRQIHVHKVDERLDPRGATLKLGRGGIREVEFYVQTQQLILGGRNPALRSNRTLDALAALTQVGQVAPATAEALSADYAALRSMEHRVQMLADEQTHILPEKDGDRRRVAALWGHADLKTFDAAVGGILKRVNKAYGELFAEDEPLSSSFGSLVFTGVDDDPETLATLARMGFSNPGQVSSTIRTWHHGRIGPTRTERGRELFTRLAPQLLEAAHASGAPDPAFNRFADFFAGLSSGVQIQSLFLAQPKLFELIVRVMAFAPELAATLARRPAALDALLDRAFFADPGEEDARLVEAAAASADGYESAMDAVRRVHREQAFRIGVQVMSRAVTARDAGEAFAVLADACIRALAPVALAEVSRIAGDFPGDVAVVALGKAGSREMTARSDLDLMAVYRTSSPSAMSATRGWAAETFYARFTQRLVTALSAPTAEGPLYEVDLQLRPSGSAGPVAVSQAAFEGYYAGEAETWEMLALTRARVVWTSDRQFGAEIARAVETALRRPRPERNIAKDVKEMRALLERERPPSGFWDVKLSKGGLVDVEFAAQYLQLAHASAGGPLRANTAEALKALGEAGLIEAEALSTLLRAWSVQQDLSQLLKVALRDEADPSKEPEPLKALLAEAGGSPDFKHLQDTLKAIRVQARSTFETVLGRSPR
jgi:[glutamine synthetase] adenylyltransferase / [glutamine synthetase]-adenylyl-L-tyrosine phosphorylase